MRTYPQYELRHYTLFHAWQGGLTADQVQVLYDYAIAAEMQTYRMQAALHGFKLDEKTSDKHTVVQSKEEENRYAFRGPEAYASWTDEQKKAETRKMLSFWKGWAGQRKDLGVEEDGD